MHQLYLSILTLLLSPTIAKPTQWPTTPNTTSKSQIHGVKSYGLIGGYACCSSLSPVHTTRGAALLHKTGNNASAFHWDDLIGSGCQSLPKHGCGSDWFVGCVPYLSKDGSICVAKDLEGDGRRTAEFIFELGDMIEQENGIGV